MKFSCIPSVKLPRFKTAAKSKSNSKNGKSGKDDEICGNTGGEEIGNLNDYQIVKKLNCGRYGRVVLARNTKHRKYYAIKLVETKHTGPIDESRVSSMMQQEVDALTMCSGNPFVVHFYGVKQTRSCYALIQEHAQLGDLATIVHRCGRFTEDEARFYIAEVILGLQFVHSLGIVHRDIKLENIVLDAKGHAKIIDFGESMFLVSGVEADREVKEEEEKTILRGRAGTLEYMAPEIFRDLPYDFSVDLFSLGVCAYCLLTGCLPFEGNHIKGTTGTRSIDTSASTAAIRNAIVFETPAFPAYLSLASRQLLMGLLWKNPKERLGCPFPNGQRHLRRHPFFSGIDWKSVARRAYEVPKIVRQFVKDS